MTASIADKLDEARALIEKGWCQHDDALDDAGHPVRPCSIGAARFCAWGAIDAVAQPGLPARETREAFRKATDGHITIWNDAPERTQAEVIEAFRKAAELARQEQSA